MTMNESKFSEEIREHERRRLQAMAMGGPEKLARRRANGVLNARERLQYLLDEGSWRESGLFGVSNRRDMADQTPADGKVTGFGMIEGRQIGVVAYDFTVKGSSSSPTSNRKMSHIKRVATARGFPLVFLSESTGIRMPDTMGGRGMGLISSGDRFLRSRESPWVCGVFGFAFGSAAWHAVASDFTVMRKGAVMAVSSSKLVRLATGNDVSSEELGGWELHAKITGYADAVAESDEEGLDLIRRFLSYLPSNSLLQPPRVEVPAGSDDASMQLLGLLPENSRRVYDVRPVVQSIVDVDSYFELKALFAPCLTTCLARIQGRTVGIIANNPRYKAGALDANACDKATSFIVLCDSYNIPLVCLADQPGFLIGREAEGAGILGKVINWMQALSLCTVPVFSIITRKSYGQAFVNMGAGGMSDEVAAWWLADVSFMSPQSAARIVYGVDPDAEPEGYERRLAEMALDNSAYSLAANFGTHEVIDPRETRSYLAAMLDIYDPVGSGVHGKRLLANWPSSYR